jgi:hypothetical protein
MRASQWASATADGDLDTLDTLLERLPVSLIATSRNNFKTCGPSEKLSDICASNKEDYDHFPVVDPTEDGRGTIIGILDVTPHAKAHASLLVSEVMWPLAEEHLIGSDASILEFVRDADHHRCRLVVSGCEISGLVSLADIQRLPVRAVLFAIITHLEGTMADAIRRAYDPVEVGIAKLRKPRRDVTYRRVEESKTHDAFVETLLCTQFCDKVTMLMEHKSFVWSKTKFEKELKKIQKLRDGVAHTNDYGATRVMAEQTCDTVRLMDKWIELLSNWQPAIELPSDID